MDFDLKNEKFSLVLSGGGALGLAQLGVVQELEENNIIPSEVIGTSMGGIIASCIAIGLKEKEISNLFQKFSNVFKILKFSFDGNSIIKSEKIEKVLDSIFQNKKMNETLIPLKLITTNLLTGDIKVFDKNDDLTIKQIILSTIAIPGVFEEQIINNIPYGDGFLVENLGINQSSYNNILAVDVLGKNSFSNDMPNNFFKTNNVLEMFEKSMRLLIYNQTKINLKNIKKNIKLIEPNTKDFKTFHFHKVTELKKLGLNILFNTN